VCCSTIREYNPFGEEPEILPQQQRQCQVTPYRDTKRIRPVKDITPEHISGSEDFFFIKKYKPIVYSGNERHKLIHLTSSSEVMMIRQSISHEKKERLSED
jgi:hypothetical protein